MATDIISESLGGFFSGSITLILTVVAIMFGLVVVGGFVYYFFVYKKKFNILVKIQSERAGDPRILFDQGAIMFDSKNKEYFLKLFVQKKEIEIPNYSVIHHTNRGDYIELLRKSERDFRFLSMPKVDREYMIKKNGKIVKMADVVQRQMESDIGWIIQREKKNKKIIEPESILMKLLEYTPQIISAMFSIMVLWMLFKYVPGIMGAFQQLAESVRGGGGVEIVGSLGLLSWKKKISSPST